MKKRSDMISLLRVIATLMVVAVHCGQALPLPSLMHQIVLRGKYGVVLFYVLCGFLALMSIPGGFTPQFRKSETGVPMRRKPHFCFNGNLYSGTMETASSFLIMYVCVT